MIRKCFILIFLINIPFACLYSQRNVSMALTIGISEQFYSKNLKETRTINISFPANYNPSDTSAYPVVFIPDGGIHEDFVHIAGLVKYFSQPWIGRFPNSIIVGIENTYRKRDFTFAVANLDFLKNTGYKKEDMPGYGGSEAYINFLKKELQPYLRQKYKTNQSKTIIGESLAGLLAAEILLKYPDVFDTYIIVSPSLWWGNEQLLEAAKLIRKYNERLKVYIGVPDKKEDIKMYESGKKLYNLIHQNKNIITIFDYLPEESHATVFHQAVYNALKKLYKSNSQK